MEIRDFDYTGYQPIRDLGIRDLGMFGIMIGTHFEHRRSGRIITFIVPSDQKIAILGYSMVKSRSRSD